MVYYEFQMVQTVSKAADKIIMVYLFEEIGNAMILKCVHPITSENLEGPSREILIEVFNLAIKRLFTMAKMAHLQSLRLFKPSWDAEDNLQLHLNPDNIEVNAEILLIYKMVFHLLPYVKIVAYDDEMEEATGEDNCQGSVGDAVVFASSSRKEERREAFQMCGANENNDEYQYEMEHNNCEDPDIDALCRPPSPTLVSHKKGSQSPSNDNDNGARSSDSSDNSDTDASTISSDTGSSSDEENEESSKSKENNPPPKKKVVEKAHISNEKSNEKERGKCASKKKAHKEKANINPPKNTFEECSSLAELENDEPVLSEYSEFSEKERTKAFLDGEGRNISTQICGIIFARQMKDAQLLHRYLFELIELEQFSLEELNSHSYSEHAESEAMQASRRLTDTRPPEVRQQNLHKFVSIYYKIMAGTVS